MPVLGDQQASGYRNCNGFISYLHARFNDTGTLQPPGSAYGYTYINYDGLWHVAEHNGEYYGNWWALADHYLDYQQTYAGCRRYG
jgi:hypothetical protein